jgi:ribonuclease HI
VVTKVKTLLPSVNLDKKVKVCLLQPPRLLTSIVCWFDKAAQSSALRCGAGGIIKFSDQTVYKWTLNCGQGTNTRVELLGAWATLFLAQRLNLDVIQVIDDSKIIIEWLKDRGKLQIASLMGWMDRLKMLKSTFREIHFTHVYRELNMEADHLSKMALTKTEGKLEFSRWVEGNEGPTISINLF